MAKNIQMKALAEDPTIFQYDELYDDMDNKREAAKETKKLEPRKAKYIGRLLEHAERRKLENELRVERQVQKDREAEGEMYKDKDTYVTAAYRKKLESIRQMQEQDARDDYLEAIGDVTKQKDLDGFYRHLYEQKLGTQQEVIKPKTAPSTEEVAYKPIKREGQISSSTKQRIYRRQRSSLDDNDDTTAIATTPTADSKTGAVKAHLANNIDADSDFSIDDSSDEDEQATAKAAADSNVKDQSKPATEVVDKEKQPILEAETKPQQEQSQPTEQSTDNSIKEPDVETVVRQPIDRSYIWRKRTVGEAFDNALARYHERKLARRA